MTLGKRIRQVRGNRKISAFIEGYGICPNTLMNYEADRRRPDAAFLMRLCEREGVEPNWLLGFKDAGDESVTYKRHVLEMVAAETARRATFQVGPKMGKLLTLAYERAVMTNAGRRQVEEIVRDLLEFLDGCESEELERPESLDDPLSQIAC
ncbi:helix-turn-helix domain-containing protein [Geothermobacter hydrogeniphilus]|uniref:HTH cro/C1-type domain-containing protein n=1 Tax=Geothermobacter hydrogeniphilus TaxID=1969733 RepID=A0A1X0XX54_9BACT|nr:helix-turn-helix transcriptional regulator [Geothermobacter hydrogeniphilus]ORJ57480.1 hypothetical protein B5V00_13605 [Geothermobacter hydrogeniphilus]